MNREQIKALLERPDVKLINLNDRQVEGISDIFDGHIFKTRTELGVPIEDILTIIANTDGARVFESTPHSMYPIIAHLNEVVPEQRFQVDNVILCGLRFGRSALCLYS